jgi:hypothetical protein
VINSTKVKWAGCVAGLGEERRGEVYTGFWWGNMRETDHLEDPGVDGRIQIRWIFRKCDLGKWTGLIWLAIGTGGEHL